MISIRKEQILLISMIDTRSFLNQQTQMLEYFEKLKNIKKITATTTTTNNQL